MTPEETKNNVYCEESGLYSKDEMKQLHFYCEHCHEEMKYGSKRKCPVLARTTLLNELIEEVEKFWNETRQDSKKEAYEKVLDYLKSKLNK